MASSSASSSRCSSASSSGTSSPDRLYGQKALAEFCEHVVSRLFNPIAANSRPGVDTPPLSPDSQTRIATKQPPALVEFIAYALYRTRLPPVIIHQALFLLKRLKARYPSARGTASSPHRLFLSALMLSSKISMDDTYSNKSWAIVGGSFFALREVNQMERELFAFLDFSLVVEPEELNAYVKDLESEYKQLQLFGQHILPETHDRKRRRSESTVSQDAVRVEEALRHKRAADAAIALLRPSLSQAARYRAAALRTHRKPSNFCDMRFSCSSSSSSSPSTPEYRDSNSSSAFSSAATSPATPASDLSPSSIKQDSAEIADTCDKFESVFQAKTEAQIEKRRSSLPQLKSQTSSI